AAEAAKLVVVNGAGLEDFMSDLLMKKDVIDASEGIALLESCRGSDHTDHSHEADPHIWLSITNAKAMAKNIYYGLCAAYPEHQNVITANMTALMHQLEALDVYAQNKLKDLSCREMITFHDGFAYFAQDMGLTILATVEEESGSEASSQELIALIELVRQHNIPGIFMEENGSDSAAKTISVETGVNLYILNMAMSGEDYFAAMYHNIETLWEALR
ncbi:MAG: zinc ABC transporter substrate-binding protein, partial [Oscillospiraceae bacterium]|nr:zinc ABC transporter substrate-binding protein [Oscillospiraceae bacterium]